MPRERAFAPLAYLEREPDGFGARPLWRLLGMQEPWHPVEERAPRHLRLESRSLILGKARLDFEFEEKARGCKISQTASFEAPSRLSRVAWALLFPFVSRYLERLLSRVEKRGRVRKRRKHSA